MIPKIFILFLSMIGTVVFTAVFVFIFANSVNMTCTKQQDNTFTCQVEKRLLDQVPTSRYTISGVIGASTEEDCDDGCSYRTELLTVDGGRQAFNDVYTDFAPVQERTNEINARIKQSDGPAFSVTEGIQWWLVIMLGGMAVIGLGVEALFVFREAYRWWVSRSQI